MRGNLAVAVMTAALAAFMAGCSHQSEPIDPLYRVQWANETIEESRALQRFTVAAAPLERKIETLLRREPRLETVRFAFQFGDFGRFDWNANVTSLRYSLVVTQRDPISQAELSTLLASAFREAGFRAYEPFGWLNVDDQWVISYQTAWLQPPDPADVSSLEVILLEDAQREGVGTTQPNSP